MKECSDSEFAESMVILAGAFVDGGLLQEAPLKAWKRYLGGYSAEVFMFAVDEAVRKDGQRPPISRMLELCRKYKNLCELRDWLMHRCDGLQEVAPADPEEEYFKDLEAHPYDDGWRICDRTDEDDSLLEYIQKSGVPVDGVHIGDYWVNKKLGISAKPRPGRDA